MFFNKSVKLLPDAHTHLGYRTVIINCGTITLKDYQNQKIL